MNFKAVCVMMFKSSHGYDASSEVGPPNVPHIYWASEHKMKESCTPTLQNPMTVLFTGLAGFV